MIINTSPFEETWLTQTMNDFNRKMNLKKDLLITEKLIEKGFGHLVEGMEKRRFPKVCCVIQDGWSYYYADNDTPDGAFIVAIKDFSITHDVSIDNGFQATLQFAWQDKSPLLDYLNRPV